jgi:hypothetical protein
VQYVSKRRLYRTPRGAEEDMSHPTLTTGNNP